MICQQQDNQSNLLKVKYILYLTLSFSQYLPMNATHIKTQRFVTYDYELCVINFTKPGAPKITRFIIQYALVCESQNKCVSIGN